MVPAAIIPDRTARPRRAGFPPPRWSRTAAPMRVAAPRTPDPHPSARHRCAGAKLKPQTARRAAGESDLTSTIPC